MSEISVFKSRTGRPDCTPEELFSFVTDIRNFSQFIKGTAIEDLVIGKDACSFRIQPLGSMNIRITGKEPVRKVEYRGTAMGSNDFHLLVEISKTETGKAEVGVTLNAELNPILKMMAAKPVDRFMETLIDEMEKFRGWNKAKA